MKTLTLFLLLTLQIAAPKPKFKLLMKGYALNMGIKGLPPDTDDILSRALKDTLIKMGIEIVPEKAYHQLVKQYYDNVLNIITTSSFVPNRSSLERDLANYTAQAYARGQPGSQRLVIHYSSSKDTIPSFANCDSVGFSYSKLPRRELLGKPILSMWSMQAIGTRSADSVMLFLLKQL